MHQVKYSIKTKAPVLISRNTGDTNMNGTHDYIPGSVLLGAFAARYTRSNGLHEKAHENRSFFQYFLDGGIIFSNAYPYQQHEHGIREYSPVPLSIRVIKKQESSAVDLFSRDPDTQTTTIAGYCCLEGDIIRVFQPEVQLSFHHSRSNRIKGHSTDGEIFNYEAIASDQLFMGSLIGEKKVLTEFVRVMGDSPFFMQLGRSRSAQYGNTVLEFISKESEEISFCLPDTDEFILSFISPVIIYNRYGFPTTSLDDLQVLLAERLGVKTDEVQIRSFKQPVEIENFISVWGLKRPSDMGFQAGSCFLIKVNSQSTDLPERIAGLQKKGLGERLNEGFGRVVINWQKKSAYSVVNGTDERRKKRPSSTNGMLPELAREFFKGVIQANIKRAVERSALQDHKRFDAKSLTNSLLSRLEMILKDSGSKEEFMKRIESLPSAAGEKLGSSRSENKTLSQFIQDGSPELSRVMHNDPELEKFANKINIEEHEIMDGTMKEELYRLYWFTFLRMIRKTKKREVQNG